MQSIEMPPRILFPHIAKTGGTALLYHFRTNWGKDKIFVYGPHNRVRLFFEGAYQFEEMPAESKKDYRIIQGHGVNENIIHLQDDADFRLMVVLREPVSLARSRFNQRLIGAERRGIEITSDSFMKKVAANPLTIKLLRDFPSFVDPGLEDDADKAISVLRKFDFVLTTEQLNAQLRPMFRRYGLPEDIERRRVAEKKTPLMASDDEIHAVTGHDKVIHEAFNHVVENDGTQHNAMGFDADGKARLTEEMKSQKSGHPDDLRAACYAELAKSISSELRAEAAFALFQEDQDLVPVVDKAAFKEYLEQAWNKRLAQGLSESAIRRSEYFKKRVIVKARRKKKKGA